MIVIAYINDIVKDTYDALCASDINTYLCKNMSVAIKPNLVVARPASDGATTHPEVVEGIIRYLKDFGVADIKIIESSWVGETTKRAFKACGYEDLSHKYDVPLVDLKADQVTTLTHGEYKINVCNEALKTDFLINVPVLKAHCQTRLTCNMKNLKGCIPDNEKRNFHSMGLHKPIAALNALIKTGYCVVDGICGDLTFEEGGNPVRSNRIILGQNPVLLDSFCTELIGYTPDEIGYLSHGKKLGLGSFYSPKTKVLELNPDKKPAVKAKTSLAADRYKHLIREDAPCSACYSSLIYALHRLGGKAPVNIHIGQGFKGKSVDGVGIGNCTQGFSKYVPGCPPKATDIMEFLRL
ncbi:MAG: DUF362 domain-containing protein [Defluviitaleaceae bacterium]|nr:DUF362 domain-containing protein [Defluviitaleaceae bacterium]